MSERVEEIVAVLGLGKQGGAPVRDYGSREKFKRQARPEGKSPVIRRMPGHFLSEALSLGYETVS